MMPDYLGTDFDFRYRLDRSGCRHCVGDGAAAYFGSFEPDATFSRFACEEPDASGYEHNGCYSDNNFLVHMFSCFIFSLLVT